MNNRLHQSIEESLNKITNIALRKRLIRELSCFTDPNLYLSGLYLNENLKPIVSIVEIKNNKYINILEFEIPRDYPFTFPLLKINNQPYSSFLRIESNIFREILYKMTKQHCLCCHSYACYSNWTPVITLKIFIDQINKICKLRRNIVNKYYADKIKKKYLIQDIDFDSWLF